MTNTPGEPAADPANAETRSPRPRRVLVLGATGTIGRATTRALVARGHDVVCFVRPGSIDASAAVRSLDSAAVRFGKATDPDSLMRDGFRNEHFDVVVSCMASRTGAPKDAWAVDYEAHINALETAKTAGVTHFVLLSAMCVQRPHLAFQHAKLAFEQKLIASGLAYSIVRPTAFFKSLSGQVERVRNGKRFVVFGDGRQTACKPISDRDLACYLADCLDDPAMGNRILPIGGPGPAITPREQGEKLFALTGRTPRFAEIPVALLDAIGWGLAALGVLVPPMKEKAELARIGCYYATESMLVLDQETGRYSADKTPSTGSDTLFDFYAQLVAGHASAERGAHKVF